MTMFTAEIPPDGCSMEAAPGRCAARRPFA
jgi:hypothetical protein